jgi:hypothetical protein
MNCSLPLFAKCWVHATVQKKPFPLITIRVRKYITGVLEPLNARSQDERIEDQIDAVNRGNIQR